MRWIKRRIKETMGVIYFMLELKNGFITTRIYFLSKPICPSLNIFQMNSKRANNIQLFFQENKSFVSKTLKVFCSKICALKTQFYHFP